MGFARRDYWERVAVPSCRGPSQPRNQICVSYVSSPCGFRVTALVFCKRIATKSGFLPLWVLSHLLNEIGSWPVWWVWPVGSMIEGSEPGGRVWVWRSYSWDPFPPVVWCDPLWPRLLPRSPPTYWLPGHPSHLLPPWSFGAVVLWYCQLQVIHGHFCQQSLLNSPQIIQFELVSLWLA